MKAFRRLFRAALFFAVFVFIVFQLWQFFIILPVWSIKEIEVEGLKHLSEKRVEKIAGVKIGTSLLEARSKNIKENLGSIRQIKSVRIKRALPAKMILVITERKPWVRVDHAGKQWLIDDEGIILSSQFYNYDEIYLLPIVRGLKTIGQFPDFAKANNDFIDELSHLVRRDQIVIFVDGSETIVRIADYIPVYFGRPENLKEKIDAFAKILPFVKKNWQRVEYVHLKYLSNLVVKVKG
jgi:cell division protein FtsQ